MKVVLTYALSWLGLVVLSILNGILRQAVYGKYMSELSAHQLSTLIGLILLAIYIWILTRIFPLESSKQAMLIGGLWLFMTVLFEFVFGHYVVGHPWSKLFQDYNLIQGRLWLLILVWTAVAPYVFYRLRN
jgi:hypothetical protein